MKTNFLISYLILYIKLKSIIFRPAVPVSMSYIQGTSLFWRSLAFMCLLCLAIFQLLAPWKKWDQAHNFMLLDLITFSMILLILSYIFQRIGLENCTPFRNSGFTQALFHPRSFSKLG